MLNVAVQRENVFLNSLTAAVVFGLYTASWQPSDLKPYSLT